MASRSRINRMLNLVEEKGSNNFVDSITEETQYGPEELIEKSQKPSSSKTLRNRANNSTVNTQLCANELLEDCPMLDCSDALLTSTSLTIQPQTGELQEYSPIPGCSKDLTNDLLTNRSLCKNTPGREHASDISFTVDDLTFLVCFDLVSSLIDNLPCFNMDYSSGSDDDYVLDTDEDSSESDYGQQRQRYRDILCSEDVADSHPLAPTEHTEE